MSPLIVRRLNLDRYGRAVADAAAAAAIADVDDGSINEVVAVLLLVALSEFVDNFHCLFLSPLMVAMGNICARHLFHFQSSLEWARLNPLVNRS